MGMGSDRLRVGKGIGLEKIKDWSRIRIHMHDNE